jgi:hypothetical protein
VHGNDGSRCTIDAGTVCDLPCFDEAAEESLTMDERRAINSLLAL